MVGENSVNPQVELLTCYGKLHNGAYLYREGRSQGQSEGLKSGRQAVRQYYHSPESNKKR